jgi:hypothetical protein
MCLLVLDLSAAEQAIALVPRATPRNVFQEIQRLTELCARGGRLRPSFTYDPPPDLKELRLALEGLAERGGEGAGLDRLVADRATELELEARLAEQIGARAFASLSAERFRAPEGALSARVERLVRAALSSPDVPAEGERFASDDESVQQSLVSRVRRRAAELGLPVRVERRPGQLAIAASGHGIVAVRPGVMLLAADAERITLHELLGHVLPRHRAARGAISLLRVGTAGSVEHEEGRALVIEARAGLFDARRRRELALRHLAALAVRDGADFEGTVRVLVERGAPPASAVAIGARAHRGGGLAREIVYLPAYLEVSDAFTREPSLERWFERGRVGVTAARELANLAELGETRATQPSNSISTGV